MKLIDLPRSQRRRSSRIIVVLAWTASVLCCSAPQSFSSEGVRHPKAGTLYQYNARVLAVNTRTKTFTVRGIVDPAETLTLAVYSSTKLRRGDGVVGLETAKIGEAISGTLVITPAGAIVAVETAFGRPLPPKMPASANPSGGYGLASGGHLRDPIHGNVVTSGRSSLPITFP